MRWILIFLAVNTRGFPFIIDNKKGLDNCMESYGNWELKRNITIACWNTGEDFALINRNFQCKKLHSLCEENGGRLVYVPKNGCAETTCRSYSDQEGNVCHYPQVNHMGNCVNPRDPEVCGSVMGKRLVPDLFGDYSCQCARGFGFLEYQGECYPEYRRGPCAENEQLMMSEAGQPRCARVKNTECKEGQISWEDGNCCSVQIPSILYDHLTNEERNALDPYHEMVLNNSFDNCFVSDGNKCVKKVSVPEVSVTTKNTLCNTFVEACKSIS